MVTWHPNNLKGEEYKFSIIIPSWNNLSFLKICIDSIRRNSTFKHQIIIHVNEGTDGTAEWVHENGFDYTVSEENIGICWAMNACRVLVRTDYIVFINDDMYMLPDWDLELWNEIERLPDKNFFLSSTTIEPGLSPHPGILSPFDYGTTPETFREDALLREFRSINGRDWSGSSWPPNIIHRDIWDLVGGYSIEYFPGFYSDPDFSMKLFEAGIRYYKGIDKSRVYHFWGKSTQRVLTNNGSKQFLNKWGITSAIFCRHFLRRGQPFEGRLKVNPGNKALRMALIQSRIKRIFWLITGTGKAKGKYSYNNFNQKDI